MALFIFNSLGLKVSQYFNYNNFPTKQNFKPKEQQLHIFLHSMKMNRLISLNLPTSDKLPTC